MPFIYYSNIAEVKTLALKNEVAVQIPPCFWEYIFKLKHFNDQMLTLAGRILLLRCLSDLNLNKIITLSDLKFNKYSRPYFDYPFDFNISHSNSFVVLACTRVGKIGIDIEKVSPLNIADFEIFLRTEEIAIIERSGNPLKAFYQIWTRKEAATKAAALGLNFPFCEFSVLHASTNIEDEDYFLTEIPIEKSYVTCLASSAQSAGKYDLKVVDLHEYFQNCRFSPHCRE